MRTICGTETLAARSMPAILRARANALSASTSASPNTLQIGLQEVEHEGTNLEVCFLGAWRPCLDVRPDDSEERALINGVQCMIVSANFELHFAEKH